MKDAMHFANLAGKALGLTEHQIGGLALIFADAMTDSEQAQHEATWAMAMDYAVTNCTRPHHLLNAPCPPLQTTNEKTE